MSAEVIPFPLDRRSGTIRKLADNLRKLTTSKAIRNTVNASCDRYRASMQRRGIPDEVIEEQIQKYRNKLWLEFTGYAELPPGLRA
jgi:hypothetical protein